MNELTINGLTFEPYLKESDIQKQVQRVASEIRASLTTDNPLLLCVLNGAFVFAADLLRALDMPEAEISFVRFKSYEGTSSMGEIKQLIGLTEDITGREVVIVEDIVDTGLTAVKLRELLVSHGAKSVVMAALLFKPASITVGQKPEFVGFEIPSRFIIGYGLDLDGKVRGLRDIMVLKDNEK